MAVRAAGPDNFEDVVARVRRLPLPEVTAWALARAPDIVEARLAYSRWLVAALLGIGRLRGAPPEHRHLGSRAEGSPTPTCPPPAGSACWTSPPPA